MKETAITLPHQQSAFWKWTAIVSITLIYGTSLLLSQINTFYFYHLNQKSTKNSKGSGIDGDKQSSITGNKPLTFEDVRNGTFTPEYKSIQWIQTPESLTADSGDYIVVTDGNYTLKSLLHPEQETLLFDLGAHIEYTGNKYEVEDVIFSDNLQYALIGCNKRHNWRHSTFGAYFIYDVESKHIIPLVQNSSDFENVALAKWSPDSSKIGYVLENNVYVTDISSFTDPKTTQVTFDGGEQIFYGKPDWVYEEEVFESDSALWWSPTSSHILMLRSNDTSVPIYSIPYFVQNLTLNEFAYPIIKDIKYPKAGFENPMVDVLIFEVASGKLQQLPDSDPFYNDAHISNDDRLITEVTWVGETQILVRVTNRESDLMKIFVINCGNELASLVSRFEDATSTNEWFEITHNTLYIPKSDSRPEDGYIDVVGVNGYDHLAYFSPANSSEPKHYLTKGDWEVVGGPAAFDDITGKVYYVSTEESSIERHVYSVLINGTAKEEITNTNESSWYDVSFSKGARYLLLSYEGPNVPYQKLLDLHDSKEEIFTSNDELKNTLEKYDIPKSTFGNVELSNGVTVNYKETLPLNFDENKKYPMLFFVYGGPGSQLVQQIFSTSFSTVIASELNAVVITVDGRGTGFKGKKFRNIVHDHLGHYEVEDQIEAAKHWIAKGFIDEERTAIWGWSYGGYMTLKTLETDQGEVFKYGMSVAPVTDWRLYDSIYTERYMHTPQNNFDGYEGSKVGNNINNFKNVKKFLVMHGTGDDNVHFQNSLRLIDQFDQNGVENYDMYIFPDSDHGIRWHNAGRIVYDRLFGWIDAAFSGRFDNEKYNMNTWTPSDEEAKYGFNELFS